MKRVPTRAAFCGNDCHYCLSPVAIFCNWTLATCTGNAMWLTYRRNVYRGRDIFSYIVHCVLVSRLSYCILNMHYYRRWWSTAKVDKNNALRNRCRFAVTMSDCRRWVPIRNLFSIGAFFLGFVVAEFEFDEFRWPINQRWFRWKVKSWLIFVWGLSWENFFRKDHDINWKWVSTWV